MYSILISLAASAILTAILVSTDASSPGWTIFWGILAFFAALFLVGYKIRQRVSFVMNGIQDYLMDSQKQMQARVQAYQRNPKGDPKQMMAKIQALQSEVILNALEKTKELEPYRNWIPLFSKQINTSRMQFHYQLKNFKKVDELLPKCMVIDSVTASFKIARQFANKEDLKAIEKTFRKAAARTRYDQSGLLYGLMSWIYVREKKIDEAYKLLEEGIKKNHCDEGPNSTLKRNYELLGNNRIREFSNAGFGDQWYALFLEKPKIRYERRMPTRVGSFG